VSTYPGDGKDVETLIHKADTALYDAKKLGRSNYQFFRADMQLQGTGMESLQGSLRGAWAGTSLSCTTSLRSISKTAEVSGVEALLRWNIRSRTYRLRSSCPLRKSQD